MALTPLNSDFTDRYLGLHLDTTLAMNAGNFLSADLPMLKAEVTMMRSDLETFFSPRSVAVVGASPNPEKLGYVVIRNLIKMGYPGKIYPVNPKANEVQGLKAYSSVKDISEPVDLAIVIVPAEAVVGIIREIADKGIKHTVISSGGFSEVDEEGRKRQEEIIEISKKAGMRIIGPNTTGIVSVPDRFSTTFFSIDVIRGGAAYVAQTGIFASSTFRWISTKEHFGMSRIVGLGNKIDVDDTDVLQYLENDPETKVIAMYIEGLKHGKRFIEVAKEVSKKKPILAMKGGKTPAGAKAARSHTSSLAANDAIIDAAFRQAGIIRVHNYLDLVNYTKAFVFQQPPKSNRIGIITPSGGLGVMTADACQTAGLDLAAFSEDTLRGIRQASPPFIEVGNPYDIWPSISKIGADAAYKVAFEFLIEDKSVDGILAGFGPAEGFELKNPEFIFAASRKHPEKPIVTYGTCDWKMVEQMRETFEKNCIPMYYSPEEAAQALAIMYRYSRIKAGP